MSRILIIEDEESIAELEKDYLELSGFEVEIENDGEAGLKRAISEEFDLFILDLMLPGCDGLDVCRRIRDSNIRSDCAGHSHPEGISTENNRFSMQVRARVRE